MAKYTGPKCKLMRREGADLSLKSSRRAVDTKCKIDNPPGMHGAGTRKPRVSDYGLQLREKQKAKRFYGIYERQFRNYFKRAVRMPGNTGEQLLILLERRLDNVVCRLGFAASRAEARQIIAHGHITINGRKLDIPSYLVSTNESIGVRNADKSRAFVKGRVEGIGRPQPSWLGRNDGALEGKVITMPTRDDISLQPVHEQLIVELCSK